jgi:catechol 2,3-dioxygenase-like lactoylglutathione lyase family enzyme
MNAEQTPDIGAAPPIGGILETAVYVDDLALASAFYERLLGIVPMLKQERLHAFPIAPKEVLLLFPRALSKDDSVTSFGVVPGHATTGPSHFAFRVAEADYEAWRAWLGDLGIPVTGAVNWPQGGRSLYFEDIDGNVLEVATPGLWANYRTE